MHSPPKMREDYVPKRDNVSQSTAKNVLGLSKPLLRGHLHQAALFAAIGACLMLVAQSHGVLEFTATAVYSLTLVGLFGVSALYHRPQWDERMRRIMRRIDHAAIFALIAGTGTPICLLALPESSKPLILVWCAAAIGMIQSLVWIKAPKIFQAALYVAVGWLLVPYIPDIYRTLGVSGAALLVAGGAIYTLGALTYTFKWPNPAPRVFGYHEVFHLLVIVAAVFHFIVIDRLIR
jgi:hemolysin III